MNPKVETISPDKAREWLLLNKGNRPLSKHQVFILANQMRANLWKLNGETIIFAKGRLLDGQHRLQAVVDSGCTIESLVAWDVDEDTFSSINNGRARTGANVLAMMGEVNYTQLAACLKGVYLYKARDFVGFGDSKKTPNVLMPELLAKYPNARRCAMLTARSGFGLPRINSVACFLFWEIDATLAESFFVQLYSGDNLSSEDPIYHVRERLILQKNDPLVQFAALVTAWNLIRADKKCRRLTVPSTKTMAPKDWLPIPR